LVSPPPEAAINDEWIEHFGLKVQRAKVAPFSRDTGVEVKVDAPAAEVVFPACSRYAEQKDIFRHPGPHLRWSRDAEAFVVELVYADGVRDFAFPFSITDGRTSSSVCWPPTSCLPAVRLFTA